MADGVIVVNKEPGITSFGVVARLRRIFGQKKIGHTGTLDPDAEGVLVVCLGKATKLVERLTADTKRYRAVLLLGQATDTMDTSGEIIFKGEVSADEAEAESAVLSFEGPMLQTPPMYSALKVGGKKLVDLARKGIEVEREKRPVEFSEMKILKIDLPRVEFEVTCTKGAYIRVLCDDIGRKLGCGGAMEHLTRLRCGEFTIDEAMTLSEIEAAVSAEEEPYSFVRPVADFFQGLPEIRVSGQKLKAAMNGCTLKARPGLKSGDEVRVADDTGRLIAVYEEKDGALRPKLML